MYRMKTFDEIKTLTLAQVSNMLRHEEITEETARQYCELWNATPGRFTRAVVQVWTIMQFPND